MTMAAYRLLVNGYRPGRIHLHIFALYSTSVIKVNACNNYEKRSAWTCWGSGVKFSNGSTALPVDGDGMTVLIHYEPQR